MLENLKCYFCDIAPATTSKFNAPACEQCRVDEYTQIENPTTARKRTDDEKAKRQKMMKMAFDHAFNEDEQIG